MDDVLKDVVNVVSAVAVSLALTGLLGWTLRGMPAARRDNLTHFIGGSVALIVVSLVTMAAAVALMGSDFDKLDGEPAARWAFILTAAVGLVVVLLVNKRVPFWPNAIIIGTYALTLSVVVLLLAASLLLPPIEPLFPPKM